jgi:hypothetical protein
MSACQRWSLSIAGAVLFTSYGWGTGCTEWPSAHPPGRYRAPAGDSAAASRSAISRNGPSIASSSV